MHFNSLRFTGTREQQLANLRKEGWQIVRFKAVPVVVAFKGTGLGTVWVKAWHGNAHKPAFFNSYRSVEAAESGIRHYTARLAVHHERKAEQKAATKAKRDALKASDHWTVGDVFYNSWGYEQTNIDWYQVVALKPKSIVIRPIAKNYKETGFMCGDSQPRRNDFTGEPRTKPLSEDGRVRMTHGGCSKWDGKPAHESHYA